jgi:hypothetical protein
VDNSLGWLIRPPHCGRAGGWDPATGVMQLKAVEAAGMAEESKDSTLTIRVTPLVKAKAMRRALQEGMSLANYIAWLIERDNRGTNQKPKRP